MALTDALVGRRWIEPAAGRCELTAAGEDGPPGAGVDVTGARAARRTFARPGVDGTERRPHLAGTRGAAVATAALASGWLRRRDGRSLAVTPTGRDVLAGEFGVAPAVLGGGDAEVRHPPRAARA